MEKISISEDIKVFYLPASTFPEGVLKAHQDLHARVPFSKERRYFGLSRPENGTIAYMAAAEELQPGEAAKYDCDSLVLKKGKYISERVNNYMEDLPRLRSIFASMIEQPGIDPEGYCVEWYLNDKDMVCMVRLAED